VKDKQRQPSGTPAIASHSAVGALSGFLHQAIWALIVLLRAGRRNPNATVRVEHLDDIEISQDDHGQTLIQIKTSIQATSPAVINTSRDLWSTLHVWSDYVRAHPVSDDPENFLLFTTGRCTEGSAPAILRLDANGDRGSALKQLTKVARTDSGATNEPHYKAWRSLTDAQRIRIISAMTVIDEIVKIDGLGDLLCRELLPSSSQDPQVQKVRDSILGWWMNRIAKHIAQHERDVIRYEELVEAIRHRFNDLSSDTLPLDESLMAYVSTLEEADTVRVFVKQLRLIDTSEPRILQAVSDYYRATQHIDNWLRLDLFPPEKLREYHRELRDRWMRRRLLLLQKLGEDADALELQKAGQALLELTMSQQVAISRERTEEWIMCGSYYHLSDLKMVGWHRDYDTEIDG
jgi:hypothetical protein